MRRPTFERSDTYRTEFISKNPGFHGWYICSYCGKIIPKSRMQVDHIVALNYANHHFFTKRRWKQKDINATYNLTASCARCNKRKADNGSPYWWFMGHYGKYIFGTLWILFLLVLLIVGTMFLTGVLTVDDVRSFVRQIEDSILNCVSGWAGKLWKNIQSNSTTAWLKPVSSS